MFDKFDDKARQVIAFARQEAEKFNHDYIGTEHLLLGLIKEGNGVASNVLQNLGVDVDRVLYEIEKMVEPGDNIISQGQLPFTPATKDILQFALDEMRDMEHNYIGTEHLLLGLLKKEDAEAAQILANLDVEYDVVKKEIIAILKGEGATHGANPEAEGDTTTPGKAIEKKKNKKTPAIDAFGRDLTDMARKGELDPCIGREKEIRRMLQILCRRRKNNPILIGNPGTGKTAVAEGFAQMIANGKVPLKLKDRKLVMLDLALMVAGTKYRGQFE